MGSLQVFGLIPNMPKSNGANEPDKMQVIYRVNDVAEFSSEQQAIEYIEEEKKYIHECPKCKGRGKVAGLPEIKREWIEEDDESLAQRGWFATRGGHYEDVEYRTDIKCPLCKGKGKLKNPPKEVTKIVDYINID
jgi:RecJ-like exonuclease